MTFPNALVFKQACHWCGPQPLAIVANWMRRFRRAGMKVVNTLKRRDKADAWQRVMAVDLMAPQPHVAAIAHRARLDVRGIDQLGQA